MCTQLPLEKGAHPPPPNFDPCLFSPNGWMDEDAAWYGSRTQPRPHCTRRGPGSPEKGTAAPLGSCLLWPRSPISDSATAELLLHSSRQIVAILYNGRPCSHKNCPFPWGIWTHGIHSSLGQPESSTRTASVHGTVFAGLTTVSL